MAILIYRCIVFITTNRDLKEGCIKLLFFLLSFINKSLVFYSFGIFYEIPIMPRRVYTVEFNVKTGWNFDWITF